MKTFFSAIWEENEKVFILETQSYRTEMQILISFIYTN